MSSENKSATFAENGHPNENYILLALEHELDPEETAQVERHLGNCWSCRARSEEMQRGILAFVEYREQRYLPSLPIPPDDYASFNGRLQSAVRKDSPAGLLARIWQKVIALFNAPGRLSWMSALAVLMTVVLIWVQILNPPGVSASELLTRAVAAQNPPAAESTGASVRVARQTVRIQSGHRTIMRKFEWTIGSANPHERWDMQSNQLNWDTPLTAAAFADWRNSLREKKERVKRSGNLLTLNTITKQSLIREASIVVRANDFHPVEQHLHLADSRQLDFTEIAFEIVEQPKKAGAVGAAKIAPENPRKAPEVKTVPTKSDLDETELQLRYVLFTHQWDLGEDLMIGRTPGRVTLSGIASSAERQKAMQAALSKLSYVRLSISSPAAQTTSSSNEKSETAKAGSSALARPLLKDALDRKFTSRDDRLAFIDLCLRASDAALSQTWALKRLADRYSDREMALLKPEARDRLHEMLRSHLAGIQRANAELHPLLALLTAPDAASSPAAVPSWQAGVQLLFVQVQRQDQSVTHLLVGMEPGVEDLETASATLRSSHHSIEGLHASLNRLVEGDTHH